MSHLSRSEEEKALLHKIRDLRINNRDGDVRGASVFSENRGFEGGVRSKSAVRVRGPRDRGAFHSGSRNESLGRHFGSHTNVRDLGNDQMVRGENSRGRGTRGFRGGERGRGRGMRSHTGDRTERRGIMGSDRGRDRGGKFPNKMGNHPYTGIGYAILKSWSENQDGEELLVQMSNKVDSIEELVNGDIKEDWYTLLTKSLNTAITCQHYSQKLKKILNIVGTSHYLTHGLTKYLDQKQKQGKGWINAIDFITSILRIIQQIVKHLPECAQKCKFPLRVLLSMSNDLEAESSLQGLQGLISPVLSSVTEIGKAWDERQARKHLYLPCSDGDTPPEDFRELSVIPTVSDLFPDEEPFVRAIITKGAYKDQDHYLDVQFRLMREDFIKPLRKGIQDYRRNRHDKKFKSSEIRIYEDVHFTGMTHVNGINHVLQFDVKNLKQVKWDHSKRLLTGNLVCLSNDNFESILIFATVSLRKTEMLKKGIVNVVCHSGLDIVLKTSSSDTFILAETMAYYEAVNPILRGLQTIDFDLPLKEYIISCEKKLRPPSYLLKGVRKYDISCLMKCPRSTEVSVLNTFTWPQAENMSLNPSQREAAIQALTKEISIIQGPPGTGKTYVGLKVMQVLLENQEEMVENEFSDHDPILVICYTNHALDQFLEGILQFCKRGIVRVGGKCSSDSLEPFKLVNLKKKRRTESKAWKYALWRLRERLETYSKSIQELKEQIDHLTIDVVNENILVKCMSTEHYKDLMSVETGRKSSKSMIHEWLNVSSKSLLQTLPVMIKNHLIELVVKCFQVVVKKDKINIADFHSVSIVDRVKLYVVWLRAYQSDLTDLLDSSQSRTSQEKSYLHYLYQQSNRPSILTDSELSNTINPEIFANIQKCLGNHCSKFTSDNSFVEAWVLGLHNELSKQLDDVEMLHNFIEKIFNPEERDDFDDAEESNNIKHLRQDFEDEDDERKNLKATLQVENEATFLLNRAKLLGIREDVLAESQGSENFEEDEDGFRKVTRKKHLTFSQVQKRLLDDRLPPVEEDEEDLIYDLWSLDPKTRFSLYKLWIKRYMDQLVSQIEEKVQDYNDTKQELDETRMKEDIDVLRSAKVIGMTTTGAAKKRALLEVIGCRIIIVEEAAEVLEAHIVTALNKNCKHLILIGDHQQLRPNPTVYDHAKHFGLDVSLFERLVNNDVPHITLGEQHRMRESISKVMRHIYPNLQDHVSVKKYDNIRGVSKNIFFIQHDQREECVNDSLSKSNPFEAEYLIRLCIYFLHQEYQPSQITILATYAGQVLALKKEMKKKNIAQGIRVTAVDNFQGEENDIILLSLVRSNENSNVGFLKVDNRVCVALSRAKKGLFAIGNIKQLASQSKLWEKILQTGQNEEITGDGLPLACPNHPDKQNMIRIPQDFDKCPEGGCNEKCDFRLDCGHTCTRKCHGYDLDHKNFQCLAPCSKKCPKGHPCRRRCSQECGQCKCLVSKKIEACTHENDYLCYKEPKETDCYSQCETTLPCGHRCEGKCGECKKNGKHNKLCPVLVSYFWPCDHTVEVPCHFKPSENPCPKVCDEILNCGHKCKGTCSDCLNGAVHVACTQKCQKLLPCGHRCQYLCGIQCPPCSLPCPVSCRHGACSNNHNKRTCGESCIPCQEPCRNSCSHKKCENKCFEKCNKEQCGKKQCFKKVPKCGHGCSGLCGELCVCRECSIISKCKLSEDGDKGHSQDQERRVLIKIPSCGHAFIVDEMDKYMTAMNKEDSCGFICCPACSLPIQKCSHYDNILKARTQRREEEKKKVLKLNEVTLTQRQMIRESLSLLKEKDTDLAWFEWRYISPEGIKNAAEIQAISSKLKFAYIIIEIQALEGRGASSTNQTGLQDRISAILKIKGHMSLQQIEEYKLDLKRLLLCKYSKELKKMAAINGVDIPESSTKCWNSVLDSLNEIRPPAHTLEDGVVTVGALENVIENKCISPSEQAMFLLKKKIAKGALDLLKADDDKMLSEILSYHPRATVRKYPVHSSRTLKAFLSNSSKDKDDDDDDDLMYL